MNAQWGQGLLQPAGLGGTSRPQLMQESADSGASSLDNPHLSRQERIGGALSTDRRIRSVTGVDRGGVR